MTIDPQAPVRVALSNLLHAASRLKIMGHPIDELDSVLARRINEAGIALSTPQERLGGEEVAGMAQELRDCMDGMTELLDKKGNSLGFKMALPSGYQRIEAATFAAAALLERLAAHSGLCSDCPPVGYPTNKTRCPQAKPIGREELARMLGAEFFGTSSEPYWLSLGAHDRARAYRVADSILSRITGEGVAGEASAVNQDASTPSSGQWWSGMAIAPPDKPD